MKKQMIVEFLDEIFIQICQVREQLEELPGIQVRLEKARASNHASILYNSYPVTCIVPVIEL